MSNYLRNLIADGEHQKQDFKYCISDARKIARTISAFANTRGGTLLIGVRDNRSIAGISDDEEFYMIDSAATLYCRPEVKYTTRSHRLESKTVLEIKINEDKSKPILAADNQGRWLAYVRSGDQNFLANSVILKLWKIQKQNKDLLLEFREAESKLTEYLITNKDITLSGFRKISGLSRIKAEWTLAGLISLDILDYKLSEDGCRYFPLDIQ